MRLQLHRLLWTILTRLRRLIRRRRLLQPLVVLMQRHRHVITVPRLRLYLSMLVAHTHPTRRCKIILAVVQVPIHLPIHLTRAMHRRCHRRQLRPIRIPIPCHRDKPFRLGMPRRRLRQLLLRRTRHRRRLDCTMEEERRPPRLRMIASRRRPWLHTTNIRLIYLPVVLFQPLCPPPRVCMPTHLQSRRRRMTTPLRTRLLLFQCHWCGLRLLLLSLPLLLLRRLLLRFLPWTSRAPSRRTVLTPPCPRR
jgi:hypothetical protein